LKSEGNAQSFNKIEFMIGKLKSEVNYSTVDDIQQKGLHTYLAKVKEELSEVANALNQNYFANI